MFLYRRRRIENDFASYNSGRVASWSRLVIGLRGARSIDGSICIFNARRR